MMVGTRLKCVGHVSHGGHKRHGNKGAEEPVAAESEALVCTGVGAPAHSMLCVST